MTPGKSTKKVKSLDRPAIHTWTVGNYILSSVHLDDVTLEGIGGDTLHDLEVIMKDAEQMCLCLNNTNFVIVCHDNKTRGIIIGA